MVSLFGKGFEHLIFYLSILEVVTERIFTRTLLNFLILWNVRFLIVLCLVKLVAFELFFLYRNINAPGFTPCSCDQLIFEYFWRDSSTVGVYKFFCSIVPPSSLNSPNASLNEYLFLQIFVINSLLPLRG